MPQVLSIVRSSKHVLTLAAGAGVLLAYAGRASATQYTLSGSDPLGYSSFNTGSYTVSGTTYGWKDSSNNFASSPPSAGNDYTVGNNYAIRTPQGSGDYTFGGDSLTLGTGSSRGTMSFKGATGNTITIANLTMNNGLISNATNSSTGTFAGGLTIGAGGAYFNPYSVSTSDVRNLIITSTITGGGPLYAQAGGTGLSSSNTAALYLDASNNYSGGTTVYQYTFLDAQHAGALGTGDVTVNANGVLQLDSAAGIASGAKLIVNSSAAPVNLNYTGTDTILNLSLDGGTTYLGPGTYGAAGSGAQHTSSVFTGTGTLTVVPEPASVTLLGAGLLAALGARRRR